MATNPNFCKPIDNAHAPVTVEGGLYLRGEDEKLCRITVNAGVISATEVGGGN